MYKHAKVSAIPNDDPDLVGGDNWNEPHIIAAGTVFPVAAGQLTLNGAAAVDWFPSYNCGAIVRNGVGDYRFEIDSSNIAVEPGYTMRYIGQATSSIEGALASGVRPACGWAGDTSPAYLQIVGGAGAVDPAGIALIDFVIWGSLSAI